MTGIVVSVFKGHCFINGEGSARGVFAPRTAFGFEIPYNDTLIGKRVRFDMQQSPKGPRTSKVTLLEEGT
jgi:cold shock CspA family protein